MSNVLPHSDGFSNPRSVSTAAMQTFPAHYMVDTRAINMIILGEFIERHAEEGHKVGNIDGENVIPLIIAKDDLKDAEGNAASTSILKSYHFNHTWAYALDLMMDFLITSRGVVPYFWSSYHGDRSLIEFFEDLFQGLDVNIVNGLTYELNNYLRLQGYKLLPDYRLFDDISDHGGDLHSSAFVQRRFPKWWKKYETAKERNTQGMPPRKRLPFKRLKQAPPEEPRKFVGNWVDFCDTNGYQYVTQLIVRGEVGPFRHRLYRFFQDHLIKSEQEYDSVHWGNVTDRGTHNMLNRHLIGTIRNSSANSKQLTYGSKTPTYALYEYGHKYVLYTPDFEEKIKDEIKEMYILTREQAHDFINVFRNVNRSIVNYVMHAIPDYATKLNNLRDEI